MAVHDGLPNGAARSTDRSPATNPPLKRRGWRPPLHCDIDRCLIIYAESPGLMGKIDRLRQRSVPHASYADFSSVARCASRAASPLRLSPDARSMSRPMTSEAMSAEKA